MTNYRIIIGELVLRDKDTGKLLNDGEVYPITHSNILVDSDEVADYLVEQLGITTYKLLKREKPPVYLEHELN